MAKSNRELLKLKNVGPAVLKDLEALQITSVQQLAETTADDLYQRLVTIKRKKPDICMWDVFAAIVHEAKTGEKTPWWHWSKIRKLEAVKQQKKQNPKRIIKEAKSKVNKKEKRKL